MVYCIHDADAAGTMIYETLQAAADLRQRVESWLASNPVDLWQKPVDAIARQLAQ